MLVDLQSRSPTSRVSVASRIVFYHQHIRNIEYNVRFENEAEQPQDKEYSTSEQSHQRLTTRGTRAWRLILASLVHLIGDGPFQARRTKRASNSSRTSCVLGLGPIGQRRTVFVGIVSRPLVIVFETLTFNLSQPPCLSHWC